MRNIRERLIDDEIDLIDLFRSLWPQKLLIFMISIIITIFAVVYVFLAVPVYEARVLVHSPGQNDIAPLNYGRGGASGLKMLTVDDVYSVYLRNLQSESLRREFFRDVYLPALPGGLREQSQDELYLQFLEVVSVGVASKVDAARFFVSVETSDPERAADWAVLYAESAGRLGRDEIVQNVMTDAMVKANNLEQEINLAREGAHKQREDLIVQLTEALRVAKTIGLESPPIISNSLSGEISASMDGSLVYMRGTKALQAEIENLRNRVSDDPFVPNLRERQESLAFYRALKIDSVNLRVYRQDGAVEIPDRPIRPRTTFIIALAAVVGIAVGVGVAFFRNLFFRNARRDGVVG